MERDFLGLNSKNSAMALTQEFNSDASKNTLLMSGSGIQWSLSNKNNAASDKKAGTPYAMPIYPFHNADAIYPISNRPTNAVPVFQSQLVSSVVGSTELRHASKLSGSTTQLTMFYAGSVCVYNDISPEKAQAIMLLAGSCKLPQTRNIIELPASAKPIQTPTSHLNHSEPPKDTCSVSPIAPIAPTFIPAAVPQARKASLARFLEKRKERINTCPYNIGKKASDCSSTTLDLSTCENRTSSPMSKQLGCKFVDTLCSLLNRTSPIGPGERSLGFPW